MRRFIILITSLLSGCVMGIPDADSPVVKLKPCEKIVILQPENKAVCLTKEAFGRYIKGTTGTLPGMP